jgi:hypothetical protein
VLLRATQPISAMVPVRLTILHRNESLEQRLLPACSRRWCTTSIRRRATSPAGKSARGWPFSTAAASRPPLRAGTAGWDGAKPKKGSMRHLAVSTFDRLVTTSWRRRPHWPMCLTALWALPACKNYRHLRILGGSLPWPAPSCIFKSEAPALLRQGDFSAVASPSWRVPLRDPADAGEP